MFERLLLTSIAVPVFGSVLVFFWEKAKGILAVILLILTAAGTASLVAPVMADNGFSLRVNIIEWFNIIFTLDGLSIFMAVVSCVLGLLIAIYSLGYMKNYQNQAEYYFLIVLFVGSMVGLIFSGNLMLMYIFWELTAVCSWRLIGFYREKEHLLNADKALLVTVFGSTLMLVGFGLIYRDYGTLDIFMLKGKAIEPMAFYFILAGILAKSAQLPLHMWLPDAGVAPTPVTALLHAAVLVKIGVYAFARIFVVTFIPSIRELEVVSYIAVATVLVAGTGALLENDIKRILAYSTVSQIGYILLGLSVANIFGTTGAIFYILAHGFGKAGLFLSAGIVEHNTHTKDINKLGGLAKTMPVTAFCFLICSLSIIGLPPFAGFYGKAMVIMGVVKSSHYLTAFLAVMGAVLTMMYLLRFYNKVFMGETAKFDIREGTGSMVFIVVVMAVVSLLIGIFPQLPIQLIGRIG